MYNQASCRDYVSLCLIKHTPHRRKSGDRIPVGARFSALLQTGPGAHSASCTMGTVPLPGVKSGRGVTLTPHPLLLPWSRKSRAIPVLPIWSVRPVQSLSACARVHALYFYADLSGYWLMTPRQWTFVLWLFTSEETGLSYLLARAVMGKLRPAGQIRPPEMFYPARATLFLI